MPDLPEFPLNPRSQSQLPRAYHPREKLFARGPDALTPTELLTLLIAPGDRARGKAEALLRQHGLSGVAALSAEGWRRNGLGEASAARMCAVFELARRTYATQGLETPPILSGPHQVYRQVRHLARAKKEHLVGLYLDAQNGLLQQETISIGSLNTTRTHPREILYPAVKHLALGFILAHNHPSGCLEPSSEDVHFTSYIKRAAELMGIELYDHLVVARGGYTSFRDRGLL